MDDFKKKYLKYKEKYINKLKQSGGKNDKYLSVYNKEVIKLKKKYKNIRMCCDDKKTLNALLKDIHEVIKMDELESNLGKLNKHLDTKITDKSKKQMMNNFLRIFLDDDLFTKKEKIEQLKKYFSKNTDIKFKEKCSELGETISNNWNTRFYKHKTNKKRIIKEKKITYYNIKSDGNYDLVSSLLDEIKIYKRLENTSFIAKLLDYYICEKNEDLMLYMEIENKGIPLSKWFEEDNMLTENHKKIIMNLMIELHKLNIIYNNRFDSDNLLVDTKSTPFKFYINNFEYSDTKAHIFTKAKKNDIISLKWILEWSNMFDENTLISLIICDCGIKFTF